MLRTRARPRSARLALLAGAALAATLIAFIVLGHRDRLPSRVPTVPTPPPGAPQAGPRAEEGVPDPFAWTPERSGALARRAAAGTAHVLYAFAPGGAVASAARTAQWRGAIARAAAVAGVSADRLEALVFLESAGRADAQAPGGADAAAGLTQILAETGRDLLGLRVDAAAGERYGRRIARAQRRGRTARVAALERARARVDERFDPVKALAATGRYLAIAKRRFGREDLAFVSYHMGMGNLEDVLARYGEGRVPYARLYFDSTPTHHAAAYRKLVSFGDDSANYLWKIAAAEQIMALWRRDPAALARTALAQTSKNSAEEVLHPPAATMAFAGPQALRAAWAKGDIRALPDLPRLTGLRRDAHMGELAERLHQPRGLYRGLRPEALAMALYIGAQTRFLGGPGALTVTSTVRDYAYQRLLVRRNPEATRNFSLHTTGWAFDVARRYASRRQALAFQFILDRLQVLNAIAWVREPAAIHITVSRDAAALLPLLGRLPR